MNKREKKNVFVLKSNDNVVKEILSDMKLNSKIYTRLISALQILGTFDGRADVEIYDCVEKNEDKKIRLWCSDLNDNLLVFYAISNDKKRYIENF